MPIIREVRTSDWHARLDISSQRLALEIPEIVIGEDKLFPTLPTSAGEPVSAAILIAKAKQFDDGLMAAIELAVSAGLAGFPGKASLLSELASTLDGVPAELLWSACGLGNLSETIPPSIADSVRNRVNSFLSDETKSKPLGFYTWSPDLTAVFRRDRFLQTPLSDNDSDAIAAALERIPNGTSAYAAILRLASRLTNPFMELPVTDAGSDRAVFPRSWTPEIRLFQRLYGDRLIPEGFELMSEVLGAIRRGDVSLRPTAESGWYDYQMWAIEPFATPLRTPEGAQHEYGERYRTHLEELFRGAATLTRETHVKQAGGGYGGYAGPRVPPIYVGPDLNLEPIPTFYSRRADAYRFVRNVLDESFGSDWQGLHRLTADGPVREFLGSELAEMEMLFAGAAALSARELGLPAVADEFAEATFHTWRANVADDPDVGGDVRCVVPVFFDVARRKTKVWAFLGWRTLPVDVDFRESPKVISLDPIGTVKTRPPEVKFHSARYHFAEPVTAEVYVTKIPNRAEFRALCDRYGTRDSILANLR